MLKQQTELAQKIDKINTQKVEGGLLHLQRLRDDAKLRYLQRLNEFNDF